MICIFDKKATVFEGIGLGALSPESCKVSEKINNEFELKMRHPRDNAGKWRYIEIERILYVETPSGYQPFRIYRITPTETYIDVYARHIFYDLLSNISTGKILDGTAKQWMNDFDFTFAFEQPFTFGTDIDSDVSVRQTYDGENQVSMLIGSNDSFIEFFGGEIIRDHFSVFFAKQRGTDSGYLISYGKNLDGITIDEDLTDTFTWGYAYGSESAFVKEKSPRIDDYANPIIKFMEFSDTDDREVIKKRIQDMFAAGSDLPTLNVKIDFIQLEKTEEYKEYKYLRKLQIGDTVRVYHPKMNFEKDLRMVSYDYDAIRQEYTGIQLGEIRAELSTSITDGMEAYTVAKSAKSDVTRVANVISGNVAVTPDFLYLPVDTDNYQTAQKVYRLGKNGVEYSSNGYDGTFSVLLSGESIENP